MKIMIDGTSLARQITGIENYTKNLIVNLIELNKNTSNELTVLFRREIPDYLKQKTGYKPLVCPFESQLLCEQIWIPYVKSKYKPDIIHFPAFPPGLLVKNNVIFTIHDATMWKYKETISLKNKLYMKPLSTKGIKVSSKLITISESSKENLLDVFPGIENKLFNCGNSISDDYRVITDSSILKSVKEKYKLPNRFFLTVGSLEPRKNLLFLINTYLKFKKEHASDFKLVITGRSAWGSEEIKKIISDNKAEEDIILTGYVSDNDLIILYNIATYFVFPSIYEGFGLPVLEAMASGTPVISSNSSSLPEVAGDAAIYFDPTNENELKEIFIKISNNEEIHEEYRKKGLERRKLFSWMKVAENIYSIYLKM
ncbi:glycosyltransferase family 4 protein [Bacillus sp. 1P02SD]|uniref:glycosyltransferase family 4 protein n=1 Tax=Bacillus sp. 1P02SD TaxID=3132264 RepID=UPI0039A3AA75